MRMGNAEKRLVTPMVTVAHNKENAGLLLEIALPGATKESLDLDMGNNGFCLKAEAKDVRYDNCLTLGHEIIPEDAKARFDAGVLKVDVPSKETITGHKVAIA